MKRLNTYNMFNESVRDQLKPKSKKELKLSFMGMVNNIHSSMDKYPMKIWDETSEICKLLDESPENLYFIDNGDNFMSLEVLFENAITDSGEFTATKIETPDGEWLCYPLVKLAYWSPDDMAENFGWVFNKDFFVRSMNESVRDSMKPKSVEDIMNALDTNPKDILKIMRKIRVDESDLYSYIYKTLSKEKIRDVFIDYICDNKEKLHSKDTYLIGILKNLEDLIGYMNDIHNIEASTSLHSTENGVWDEVTMRLYQELTDEEMKDIIKKAINNEKS